ncbi:YcxB family protein [Streptomyces sp. NPDC049597]|uniref:YcxB family protein n=1 Tax=Streptomyces sp. NPDC049597 TaxID=3155276 RepID=UPI003434D3DA
MDHQGRGAEHTAEAIELTYRHTRAGILAAVLLRERYRRMTLVRRIVAGLLLCTALLMIYGGRTPVASVAVWLLLSAFVWAIPYMYTSQALRIVEWQGEYRTTVTEDGVATVNDHCALTQRWTLFRGYGETDDAFVLLSRDRGVMWVETLPKQGLRDPRDADRLRELLDRHLRRL